MLYKSVGRVVLLVLLPLMNVKVHTLLVVHDNVSAVVVLIDFIHFGIIIIFTINYVGFIR